MHRYVVWLRLPNGDEIGQEVTALDEELAKAKIREVFYSFRCCIVDIESK